MTWAKFCYRDGVWHFLGLTPHDELVAEFEESMAERGIPTVVVGLAEPAGALRYRRVERAGLAGDLL